MSRSSYKGCNRRWNSSNQYVPTPIFAKDISFLDFLKKNSEEVQKWPAWKQSWVHYLVNDG